MRARGAIRFAALACAAAGVGAQQAPRPRLAVVLVVDQLASWVLAEARPFLTAGGFARLEAEGVHFSRCAYRHACTLTGPGHATIATGAPAAVHGIVGNEWYDRARRAAVYCVDGGEEAALVGGRGGPRGPDLLLAPTLADAMKAQLGDGCQVVTMSWKDRSAVLSAGGTADVALFADLATGCFVTSAHYAAALPAFVERFNARAPCASFFAREWRRTGPDTAYAGLVDDRPFETPSPRGTRTLPECVDGGLAAPGPAFYSHLERSPYANEVLLDLADEAMRAVGLGRDEVPDLLCVSFSANDLIGHARGPRSVEVRDACLRLDDQLARFLRMLDVRVGRGRYTLVLTADHGVGPVPESLPPEARARRDARFGTRVREAAEQTLRKAHGAPGEGRKFVVYVSATDLYFDHEVLRERGVPPADAARQVAAALQRLDGVADARPVADVLAGGDAGPFAAALRAALHPERSGDVAVVRARYLLGTSTTASHGTPWEYDSEVPLFGLGPGLRAGLLCEVPVDPGLAASLTARLLGIEPPAAADVAVPADVLVPATR
jgi:hypothetical protein